MSDTPTQPIMVNATPTPAQIEAGIRQTVLVLGSIAGALGAAKVAGELNTLLVIAGPVAAIIAFVLGQLHTRSQSKKLTIAAAAAPSSVAQVKGA